MSQNQKDAFLREQVRVIQEELGEDGDNEEALAVLGHAEMKTPLHYAYVAFYEDGLGRAARRRRRATAITR